MTKQTFTIKIVLFCVLLIFTLLSVHNEMNAQTTSNALGTGTSSSATKGPFQRSSSSSGSVHSRANMVYTQAEVLTTLGISSGSTISQINWDLGSTNIITASGDATMTIYMKNSSVTEATKDTWANLINGQTIMGTYTFNTSNNFPGAKGYLAFPLATNFVYTGGSIEIAVEWDCSGLTATDTSQPNLLFSGNGSLNWRWDNTAHNSLVYRAGSSSPPSDLTGGSLKAERVNTQFVYTLPSSSCDAPTGFTSSNLAETTADLSWNAVSGAIYNWKIVAAGAGSGGTAITSGLTSSTSISATGLTGCTSYDLYVQANCGGGSLSTFSTAHNFSTISTTSNALGTGTSSSATKGPFQRSSSSSSSVYSRANMVYTQAEVLTTLGISAGSTISQINWDLGSTNTITASGDATMTIYMKNSSVTQATKDTWANILSGQTIMGTYTFNTTNNFPGVKGYVAFPLATNFVYTGGSIEIAVEWDCSGLTAADSSQPNLLFSGNGSLNWRWDNTAHNSLVYRAGSNSPPSDLTGGSLKAERVNTQFVYSCTVPASFDCNGTALSADASMNTYDLITSVLAPGQNPIETPDCGHTAFGDHIDQLHDADLGKDVFRFHLHVDEDDDRCINSDRQRNEIKTYNQSPDNLLGVLGEEVQYNWKFKLDAGFQSSSKFTHIHQLKSVGASNNEDDMPQVTFTTRKGTGGNPDQLELRYAEDLTQITWAQTDLTPFKGVWVEATETVTYGDWGEGTYSLEIKKVSDGSVLFAHTENNTRMWKTNATFIRPKWGIYRSLENAADLRDEEVLFADFCIEELSIAPSCAAPPISLNATNITDSTADLSWNGVAGTINYIWKVVTVGAGPGAPAIVSGTTSNTTVSVTGLTATTSYDLHVEADCGSSNATGYSAAYNFMTTAVSNKITTSPIGTGTSSSSSRGPIHQAGTGASTRYSRFNQVFTQSELSAVGLTANSSISQLQWYITTSDIITGAGDAPCKIYLKNSSATQATQDTWAALTTGSTLVLNRTFNATDNFPGAAGWMPFTLDAPFVYTGGALEIAVEWDWDSVAFTNNGSAKWRYSTLTDDLVVRALGSSSYSTNLTYSTGSTLPTQRANIQICYEPDLSSLCAAPSNLNATNITTNSADLTWNAVSGASSYTWIVVAAGEGSGGTAIASGIATGTSASATGLSCITAYDLYVQADCGGGNLSAFSTAHGFVTLSVIAENTLTIGTSSSSSSSRGPIQQGGGTTSTRYSRFNQVFTQAELSAAGLTPNSSITELQWDLASTDIIAGTGDAPFKVYIKNSSATDATPVGWSVLTAGLTPVVDKVFNTTNNFPGVTGWMPFTFNAPFVYTGGALEIAVEFDFGSISTPAFTGSDASNPNGKSVKWRYSTFTDNVVVRSLGSGSHPSSNLSYSTSSTLPTQRANIQIVYVAGSPCNFPCEAEAGILTSNVNTICTGDNLELSTTGEEMAGTFLQYFFVYSQNNLGNTTFVNSQMATTSSASFAGLAAGDYLVCAYNEDQNNLPSPSPITTNLDDIYDTGSTQAGCFDIECSTITVPESFEPDLTGTGQADENNNTGNNIYTVEVCGGTAPYDADFSFSGGFANVEEFPSENSGCTNYQIVYTDPTDWTLTVTDANNCSNSDVIFTNDGLPSNPLPQITDYTATQETCIGDEDGSIVIEVEGGDTICNEFTYAWSGPNSFSETTTDVVTGNTVEDLASGFYDVTVTDCAGTTTVQDIYVGRTNGGSGRGRGRSGGCKTAGDEDFNTITNLKVLPNPFSQITSIKFSIAETSKVWISIYSIEGRKVAEILKGETIEGNTPQQLAFDAEKLQNGVYILELQTESGLSQHQQLMVVK